MRVAAFQLDAALGSQEARLAEIEAEMARAAEAGADLAVFPELAPTGYGAGALIADGASAPAQSLAPLQAWSSATGRPW